MTESTTPQANDVTTDFNNAATNYGPNELRMSANLNNDQTNDNDLKKQRTNTRNTQRPRCDQLHNPPLARAVLVNVHAGVTKPPCLAIVRTHKQR
jgi:hypothetical protein